MLFVDFGGVDGKYLKMLASDVPTFVQLMWIPFSELDIRQQFMVSLSTYLNINLDNKKQLRYRHHTMHCWILLVEKFIFMY